MGHIITGLTLRRALVWLPAAAYCNTGLYRAVNNIGSPPPPWWQEELGATLPRCQSPDNTILLRGWQSRERWTAGGQVAPQLHTPAQLWSLISSIQWNILQPNSCWRSFPIRNWNNIQDNDRQQSDCSHSKNMIWSTHCELYNNVCRS